VERLNGTGEERVPRKPKKSVLKYFEPVDMKNLLKDDFSAMDIGESFGYFARMPKKEKNFLNMYSLDALQEIMRKVGLYEHLGSKGFKKILLHIDMDSESIHYLKVYDTEKSPDNLLIDLRVSESRFIPDRKFFEHTSGVITYDMVMIEWLSLQNPRAAFSKDRPQLPGQDKPGLGGLGFLMKMMYAVAEGVVKDGFLDVPDHMHGAVMYSRTFKFFNPSHEAILRAILRDLRNYSLYDLSWGMITGSIIDKSTGEPQVYDPSEQLFPVSRRIMDYFESKWYVKKFKKVYGEKKYIFDYAKMVETREAILKEKDPADL
jgi:hypothetical protein